MLPIQSNNLNIEIVVPLKMEKQESLDGNVRHNALLSEVQIVWSFHKISK